MLLVKHNELTLLSKRDTIFKEKYIMNFKELILTEFGDEVQTTFWEDFSIADHFGLNAIQDTYNRAFAEWKKRPRLFNRTSYGPQLENLATL